MNEKKFKWTVGKVLDACKDMLLEKNRKYGDAALNPLKIFSNENSSNSIAIRIDDKINRIKNAKEPRKNDVIDLLGYLVLYIISKEWFDFKSEY